MPRSQSGEAIHRYLIRESWKRLEKEGYSVKTEVWLRKGARIDLLGTKERSKVGVECLVKPTLSRVQEKVVRYSHELEKLIIAYPEDYEPRFPLDAFSIETWAFRIPPELIVRVPKHMQRWMSKESYKRLRKYCAKRNIATKDALQNLIMTSIDEDGDPTPALGRGSEEVNDLARRMGISPLEAVAILVRTVKIFYDQRLPLYKALRSPLELEKELGYRGDESPFANWANWAKDSWKKK